MNRQIAVLSVFMTVSGAVVQAQDAVSSGGEGAPQPYSSVWEPVSGMEMRTQVRLYDNDGKILDRLWWRANLNGRTGDFMLALRDAVNMEPENATARAFYSLALIEWRASFFKSSQPIPEQIQREFDLSVEHSRALLNSVQKMGTENWVADIAEPQVGFLEGGTWPPHRNMINFSRRALKITNNAWTNVVFADALMYRNGGGNLMAPPPVADVKRDQQLAVTVLERSRRRFPDYPRTNVRLFQLYSYYNKVRDKKKADSAWRRIIASIRPEIRQAPYIRRYLQSIRLDRSPLP